VRSKPKKPVGVEVHPVTPERWPDLEKLFGPRGACAGCWCMYWKLPKAEYDKNRGEANKKALKKQVAAGEVPGLLAYADGQPVGWCAVAPRSAYPRLEHARTLKPIDDQPVWSVTCFFVARPFRGKGITVALLKAAIRHVAKSGGRIVEGYPVKPQQRYAETFAFVGVAAAFRKAGFTEAARPSPSRRIMRYVIKKPPRRGRTV
jgi:GNAT superfamily N-acetyltransferase